MYIDGKFFSHRNVICGSMDRTQEHGAKLNESDRERSGPHILSYVEASEVDFIEAENGTVISRD
jgi:hypothetical protein